MDSKQPESRFISKKIDFVYRMTTTLIIVNVLFMGYILTNSPNHFKITCASSLASLYTLLLGFKAKVLQLEVKHPVQALKWRRLCICVVYAASMVFEVFAFIEDMDRISRSILYVGSRLMVLVLLALHCSFGEFDAVMDSLPGTGKELKGKQNRRVITHIISFTPICGIFLLTSVGHPSKLAYCCLSYLLTSLKAFSSEKANEWKLESLVLVKMWRRVENSLLISFLILNLVVIYHTQPSLYLRNFLCKVVGGLILMTVIVHVVGVELEWENCSERKEKKSDNGEDTGEPDSMRITDDERQGNLTEMILFLLLCSLSIIVVGYP